MRKFVVLFMLVFLFLMMAEAQYNLWFRIVRGSHGRNVMEVVAPPDGTPYQQEEIVIPSEIEHEGCVYPVTRVNNFAFVDCPNLRKITLPNEIRYVDAILYRCPQLEEVILPESMYWFGGVCELPKLESIVLPENLQKLSSQSFMDCGLRRIALPKTLQFVGTESFINLNLEELDLGGLEGVDYYSFRNIGPLKKLSFPSTFRGVDKYSFCNNELEEVWFQENEYNEPISLHPASFWGNKIRRIYCNCKLPPIVFFDEWEPDYESWLPFGNSEIKAPEDYSKITVYVPKGYREIYAESNLWKLMTIEEYDFPKETRTKFFVVDGIRYKVTSETEHQVQVHVPEWPETCYVQEEINIPSTVEYNGQTYAVTAIADYVFDGCPNLKRLSIAEGIVSIGDCNMNGCAKLVDVTLSNSIKKIGERCFYNSPISSIILPDDLQTLGSQSFTDLPLTEINLPIGLSNIASFCFSNLLLKEIALDNVRSIQGASFKNIGTIDKLVLGPSVEYIGGAFSYNQFTEIWLKSDNAFYPIDMERDAFFHTPVKDIYCNSPLPPVITSQYGDSFTKEDFPFKSDVIKTLEDLKNIILYVPTEYKGLYDASPFWSLLTVKEYNFPSGLESVQKDDNNVKVKAGNGGIEVDGTNDTVVRVYDMLGHVVAERDVHAGEMVSIPLKQGVYIAVCDGSAFKVAVR